MPATLTLSADELVNQLRARGVTLQVNGSKLRASSRSTLTDADRSLIREHKAELVAWLAAADNSPDVALAPISAAVHPETTPRAEANSPDAWPGSVWDAIAKIGTPQPQPDWLTRWHRPPAPWRVDDAELNGWFQSRRDLLPREPFQLSPGIKVVDSMKFYTASENDIQGGANGPRAAGLRHDLGQLWHFHNTFLMVK